jgi:predicted nucleotidyltransferase component of viral defense system
MSAPNQIASIRQRRRNKAAETGEVFDFVLSRYAVERLLYRLSVSDLAEQFVLEGAMLFYLWNHAMHRPTRDVDFLGFGPAETEALEQDFRRIVAIPGPDDGLTFFADTISASPIREDGVYGGVRVKLMVKLGNIRIPLQIDVGFGDAITPEAERSRFPSLLSDFPAPVIRSYPVYTVVAEKLEAMVSLGAQNTRMKDFFDVLFILRTETLDRAVLAEAAHNTFNRRKTAYPAGIPDCLTPSFAASKEMIWQAFLNRNGIRTMKGTFADVVTEIAAQLPLDWTHAL